MTDLLGTPRLLIITIWVAMETMHFHMAKTVYFYDNFISHLGGPNEQYGTHERLFRGAK